MSSKSKIANAVGTLCEMMSETDCNEWVMEVGVNGTEHDGARFVIHIIRQCPEAAVEEEYEEEEE
jgi:hypothetical protein